MDNVLGKGLLLTVATTLVVYGGVVINDNFIYGVGAVLAGAGIYILREWLKKKGYPVAGKKK